MATQVKHGSITRGIRCIEKADGIHVQLGGSRPQLMVTEHGDTRSLPISRAVAEVLIAEGFSYGN